MSISFDRAADYYDRTRGYPPGVESRIAAALLAAAGATPQTRLLELGVGTGRIALPIIRAGYAYTGVDLSTAMMDKLRAALDAIPGGADRVALLQGDAAQLPLADASVEVVITVHVYHLVSDHARLAAESARVLSRPGVLLNGRDTASGAPRNGLFDAWNAILRDLGWEETRDRPSADALGVGDLWRDLGAVVDEAPGVSWQTTTSIAEALESIAGRQWSRLWDVPDAIYPTAVTRLRAWAEAEYGDALEERRPIERRFVIERGAFPR